MKKKDITYNRLDKIVLKKGLQTQLSLINLINEYFWRSWTGPFFAFAFPIIYSALLGFLMSYNMTLGSCTSMGSIIIAIYALPASIFDFKKSSLLKRIGVTPLNPIWFLICICGYYLFIMVLSVVFCFCIDLAMFSSYWNKGPEMEQDWNHIFGTDAYFKIKIEFMSLKDTIKYIDWGGFVFSFFLMIIVGTTLGMLIVSVSKTSMQLQTYSVLILIVTIIIGGQAIPLYIVRSIPALWYMGYIINPFKPVLNMATEAWNGPIPMNADGTGLVTGESLSFWDTSSGDVGHWEPLFVVNLQNWGGPKDLTSGAGEWQTQSTIWDVNTPYSMFSTIMLPGVKPGEIDILSKEEKIISFILPFVWTFIFAVSTIKLFKWSSR